MTTYYPGNSAFSSLYDKGEAQLVWTRVIADMETPVSAFMKLMEDDQPCFLLESVLGGEARGRYSIIGLQPDLLWRCEGEVASICHNPSNSPDAFTPCDAPPLQSLRELLEESRIPIPEGLPPMSAGLVGYLGYEMVALMEKLPVSNVDVLQIPDGLLMRPSIMAIFDSVDGELSLVTPVHPHENYPADIAYESACMRLSRMLEKLQRPLGPQSKLRSGNVNDAPALPFTSNASEASYGEMVRRARDYIHAGDIFQVVPSQRFEVEFPHAPFAFYRSLRHLNPSPFLFYLQFGDFQIVGSSPEILVRLRNDTVTIRPIAGTRPRGKTRAADDALAEELLADPKEQAEHLMLLDLGRNDVSRVTEAGSVTVTEQMVIERYSHVMHIVSNVEGTLKEGLDAIDVLSAGFPAGTVTGAPKIRAMEIIDELEQVQRKCYGGCVGYFSSNGNMDSCIALRTALIKDGTLYVQAGGGVVADSDEKAEYQESCNKAKALLRAAEQAVLF